ncbi:MAG TPA: SH3 domain-containing protein [bacterium]
MYKQERTITQYRVIKMHQPESCNPLSVPRGERLSFERRKTEWPGWLWCKTQNGRSAWVPEPWVSIEGSACVMERDYDSRELSVKPDDVLTGILALCGWLLAENGDGRRGWVPLDNVLKNE